MSDHTIVEVGSLSKTFGQADAAVEAIRGIDLAIERGRFVSIMGPSGSGKSTLLHLIGGLDRPTSGIIRIAGKTLGELDDDTLTVLRRQQIGFIFQAFNLLPILTAVENVALPLQLDGVADDTAYRRANQALERVGIAERGRHYPPELSGGEQQRVAVARAVINDPVLILADEPTGNLDSAAGDAITAMLRGLVDDAGHTILMVTHDPRHASIADRLVKLCDGVVVNDQLLNSMRSPGDLLAELR